MTYILTPKKLSNALERSVYAFDNDGVFTSKSEHRRIMFQMRKSFVNTCKLVGITSTFSQAKEFFKMKAWITENNMGDKKFRVGTAVEYFAENYNMDINDVIDVFVGAVNFNHLKELPPETKAYFESICDEKQVMIITNNYERHVKEIWKAKGIEHLLTSEKVTLFDVGSLRDENGKVFPKPHSKSFIIASNKMDVSLDDIVFFDDQAENIKAAEKLGILSIQVVNDGKEASLDNILYHLNIRH